ncbi:MAG: hypothetical protein IH624_07445 [Phycisphaerae bacterium]|nr:hypothetical protein [Phycisphaerae bacterium]
MPRHRNQFGALVDHYITIIEITPDYIVVGDPLAGKTRLTYEEFKDKWRNVGVEVKRLENMEARILR